MSSISSLTSSLASSLFTQLDTKKQGYIEKTDLASAFESLTTSDDSASVDDVFASLDADSDGKVTESELSTSLQSLADQLDAQFNASRMSEAMGGGMPPPPPPPENDEGFTAEELSAQLEEIGSTDSKRSSLISSIVENFDEADTDGDGKVTMQEAMAYDQASNASSASSGTAVSSTAATDDSSSSSTSTSKDEFAVMLRIMQLAQSYGSFGSESVANSLSVVA